MRKYSENYAVKLIVKCRQTPRIMSSNYLGAEGLFQKTSNLLTQQG